MGTVARQNYAVVKFARRAGSCAQLNIGAGAHSDAELMLTRFLGDSVGPGGTNENPFNMAELEKNHEIPRLQVRVNDKRVRNAIDLGEHRRVSEWIGYASDDFDGSSTLGVRVSQKRGARRGELDRPVAPSQKSRFEEVVNDGDHHALAHRVEVPHGGSRFHEGVYILTARVHTFRCQRLDERESAKRFRSKQGHDTDDARVASHIAGEVVSICAPQQKGAGPMGRPWAVVPTLVPTPRLLRSQVRSRPTLARAPP